MEKKSLRVKLTLILLAFVLLIMACTVIISNLFLGDYYIYSKQKALIKAFSDINTMYKASELISDGENVKPFYDINKYSGGMVMPEDMELSLEQMGLANSISILIYRDLENIIIDYKNDMVYRYGIVFSTLGASSEDGSLGSAATKLDAESTKMFNDYYNKNNKDIEVVKNSDSYVIQKVFVSRLGGTYIYLNGVLDNGDYVLLRSSVDSIHTYAELTNQFVVYIAVIIMIIGAIVMYIVSRRFTQPILELSEIAGKMSNMDFNTKYNVRTNDEIGTLGRSINQLSENLEEALSELKSANVELTKDLERKIQVDEMRKEFLSNVSHELKTPIALIQGYAEGLSENINDDQESRDFYCEVIIDEANKMNNLVKKLLNLNQLEFGQSAITMERFDIVDVVNSMIYNANILFKQKDVELQYNVQGPIYVWGDVYTVEEVFNNYLSNALNHVSNENIIGVSIVHEEDVVRVSVFNSGEQIPDEDIEKIWDKFYKVDKARTREYGGSGVGLSIVKASMEILGQKYGVLNRDNGVEFWFELDAKNL